MHRVTTRERDTPVWPRILDSDNLSNPTPPTEKFRTDHTSGSGTYVTFNRWAHDLYLPDYEIYDEASGQKKSTFIFKQPYGAISSEANGELVFAQDGYIYLSGWNHLFKLDAAGKPTEFEALGRYYLPELFRAHLNPDRGHCMGGPSNDIYFIHQFAPHYSIACQVSQIATDGSFRQFGLINLQWLSAAGIKVDRKENIYLGCSLSPKGHTLPADMKSISETMQKIYNITYGSIVKFSPKGGQCIWEKKDSDGPLVAAHADSNYKLVPLHLEGALWVHPGYCNIVTRWSSNTDACNCQNARFDLDDYGRLFVPDAAGGRVKVIDTNGNAIQYIGRRGNHLESLTFRFPAMAAADDNYCCILDTEQSKAVEVKLNYSAVVEAPISK